MKRAPFPALRGIGGIDVPTGPGILGSSGKVLGTRGSFSEECRDFKGAFTCADTRLLH